MIDQVQKKTSDYYPKTVPLRESAAADPSSRRTEPQVSYPVGRCEDLSRQLIVPLSRGEFEACRNLIDKFERELKADDVSDSLVDHMTTRQANAIEEAYGYTRIHQLQQISKVALVRIYGVSEKLADKCEQLLKEGNMSFKGGKQ